MSPKDENLSNEINTRMTEAFIVQMIFGIAMTVIGLVYMFISGFNLNMLMTIISGALLIGYSIYYYLKIRTNLQEIALKGETDYKNLVKSKLNETFIIQLIFGVAMVIIPLIMMISSGFNLNLLTTLISGGLLVVYSIIYYRVRIQITE